jgi:hypothetical protein
MTEEAEEEEAIAGGGKVVLGAVANGWRKGMRERNLPGESL